MASRTIDLVALRSVATIADTGGVTRAAARLNLTQSAVSMQLKKLETDLGHSLFERNGRTMRPTAMGDQLIHYARRMLELNDELWARITDQTFEGELLLGVPSDIVWPHVPTVLRRFARDYPRVKITLWTSNTRELKTALAAGEVDVILTTEADPDSNAEILEVSPLVWVGAPDGTAFRRRPLPLAFEDVCIFRGWASKALDDAGIPWELMVSTGSFRTVDACVSADFAVHAALAFVPSDFLVHIDHGGSLPPLPTTSVGLYANISYERPLAQALAAVVRDTWVPSPTAL